MSTVISDGNYPVAKQISPLIIEIIDGAKVYRANFVVENATRGFLTLGAKLAGTNAFLVGESAPRNFGGGLIEYTREFAEIPPERTDFSSYVYEFSGYLAGYSVANPQGRNPIIKTVVCKIEYKYFLTDEPEDIELLQPQEYLGSGGAGFPVDGMLLGDVSTPSKDDYIDLIKGTWIIAEASNLSIWRGNIHARRTVRVKAI